MSFWLELLHHHSFTLNNHSIFHCGVFFLSCLSLNTHWAAVSPSLVFAVSPMADTWPPISGHTSMVHASDTPLYFIFENSVMAVVREINCDLPVFRGKPLCEPYFGGVSKCLILFLLYYFQPLRQCVFLSNIPHLSLVTFNFLLWLIIPSSCPFSFKYIKLFIIPQGWMYFAYRVAVYMTHGADIISQSKSRVHPLNFRPNSFLFKLY